MASVQLECPRAAKASQPRARWKRRLRKRKARQRLLQSGYCRFFVLGPERQEQKAAPEAAGCKGEGRCWGRGPSEGQDAHLPSGSTTISHECDLPIEMHPAVERDDACLGIFPAEACDVRRDFFWQGAYLEDISISGKDELKRHLMDCHCAGKRCELRSARAEIAT